MSEPPPNARPILKLKVGPRISSILGHKGIGIASPTEASPTPTGTSTPKITLKLGKGRGSSTPKVTVPPTLPKVPTNPSPKIKLNTKKPKPSIKITTKKRDHSAVEEQEDSSAAKTDKKSGPKKIKLTTSKTPHTPYLKIKAKGKPPPRPRGVAYDSEASDREDDPAIEEEFILRMLPGEDCEYLRKATEEKRWGPRSQGGADIRLKFLQYDGRRATLTIKGRIYAASLVDMPCIVEGLKSWDRKSWYKAADICQMLFVLGTVNNEAEALNYYLPHGEVDKSTWAYAHGLTPPMRWVRKRRFKQRVSTRTIEAVEEEVERLFQMDAEAAGPVKYELVNQDRLSQGPSGRGDSLQPDSEYGDADMDADGDMMGMDDYFGQEVQEDEDGDALAAEMELAMQEDEPNEEIATPLESSNPAMDTQNATDSDAATPAAGTTSKEDSGDEESEEDEDEEEVDEDALEERAEYLRSKEEIEDIERAIKAQVSEMNNLRSDMLRKKKALLIQNLRADLELKKAAIGEGEED